MSIRSYLIPGVTGVAIVGVAYGLMKAMTPTEEQLYSVGVLGP